ncbi:MAG: arginase [Baekduia sp.]|jgi:arginase|nr:arginase [Baekduia sp.]
MGLPDVGMGAGAALLAADEELHHELRAIGWAPTLQRVLASDPRSGEVHRIFDLLVAQAVDVRAVVDRGAFPLVLAGGCISATGTVAGAAASAPPDAPIGVVWLDAHADLDTPEDNLSGSMDVMALSILTGGAWGALRATIPDARTVAEEHVALLGVRDLSAGQAARVARSTARVASGAFDADAARAAIATLPPALYLHVDLDVLDTSVGRANRYAAPGGPTLETVLATVDAAFAHGHVLAAALTAYEPQSDKHRTIMGAARTIAARIATRALAQRGD